MYTVHSLFQFRNWFEFAIPSFPGMLESAVVNLEQPDGGHVGPPTTYTLFGMSGPPGSYSDIGAGPEYGSAVLDST
jgi:hypothetical protein